MASIGLTYFFSKMKNIHKLINIYLRAMCTIGTLKLRIGWMYMYQLLFLQQIETICYISTPRDLNPWNNLWYVVKLEVKHVMDVCVRMCMYVYVFVRVYKHVCDIWVYVCCVWVHVSIFFYLCAIVRVRMKLCMFVRLCVLLWTRV
jgi:hypothetical protein